MISAECSILEAVALMSQATRASDPMARYEVHPPRRSSCGGGSLSASRRPASWCLCPMGVLADANRLIAGSQRARPDVERSGQQDSPRRPGIAV